MRREQRGHTHDDGGEGKAPHDRAADPRLLFLRHSDHPLCRQNGLQTTAGPGMTYRFTSPFGDLQTAASPTRTTATMAMIPAAGPVAPTIEARPATPHTVLR